MDARVLFLTQLRNIFRDEFLREELDGFTWDDAVFLRTAIIRIQHGDDSAWADFIERLTRRSEFAAAVRLQLISWGYLSYESVKEWLLIRWLPTESERLQEQDVEAIFECLRQAHQRSDQPDEPPAPRPNRNSAIMYIEYKGGPARIGRVTFSQTRKTIYYNTCKFQSLKGEGFKANFYDAENGGAYWISNCRADGHDTLYPATVEIDEDVREDYWTTIRNRPDLINATSFRSEGKYSKRRPQPEKPNHPACGPR